MKSKRVLNKEMARKKKNDDLESGGSQENSMEKSLQEDKQAKIGVLASQVS